MASGDASASSASSRLRSSSTRIISSSSSSRYCLVSKAGSGGARASARSGGLLLEGEAPRSAAAAPTTAGLAVAMTLGQSKPASPDFESASPVPRATHSTGASVRVAHNGRTALSTCESCDDAPSRATAANAVSAAPRSKPRRSSKRCRAGGHRRGVWRCEFRAVKRVRQGRRRRRLHGPPTHQRRPPPPHLRHLRRLPPKGTPLRGGVFVLANTLLGAGMLGLPAAFADCGYAVGLALLVFFASLGALGLTLLAYAADRAGRPASIYSVAEAALPGLGVLLDAAIAIKCFGVATSYLIVVGNTLPDAVRAFGGGGLLLEQLWTLVASASPACSPSSSGSRRCGHRARRARVRPRDHRDGRPLRAERRRRDRRTRARPVRPARQRHRRQRHRPARLRGADGVGDRRHGDAARAADLRLRVHATKTSSRRNEMAQPTRGASRG